MALSDNFESYSVGQLHGNGNWSGNTSFTVVSSPVKTGSRGGSNTGGSANNGHTIDCSFTGSSNDTQIFYVRVSTVDAGQTNHQIRLYSGANLCFNFQLNETSGGTFYFQGNSVGTFAANTWYKVEIQWQTSDDTARVRIDGGSWSSYYASTNAFTTIDKIMVVYVPGGTGTGSLYFDDFSGLGTDFTILDTVSLSDTLTSLRTRLFTISDTVSLTEALSALKGLTFTISDTIGLTEVLTISKTWVVNILDTVSLIDTVTIASLWNKITKSISSWTNQTKNSSSWSNQSKNTSSWTNQTKS